MEVALALSLDQAKLWVSQLDLEVLREIVFLVTGLYHLHSVLHNKALRQFELLCTFGKQLLRAHFYQSSMKF